MLTVNHHLRPEAGAEAENGGGAGGKMGDGTSYS